MAARGSVPYLSRILSAGERPLSDLRDQLQTTLGDAYALEHELAGGGMSRIFVAEEKALGRKVVVKVLPEEMAGEVSVDRFKREIALAAALQHPHIVPLLTAGDAGGLPYFTMPYVRGESLRARIVKEGELPVTEAMRILREVASALAFAHDAGVVHRDIKPENVLLSGGAAMVTDFGVAKALSASTAGGKSGLTSLGVALGTPAYMSPEQASADPHVDHRADLYAWGVMAYELLAGQSPFGGRPPQAMLAAHVSEEPEPLGKRRPSTPPALAQLVMRCLAKRPADRPQSATELVQALDAMTTPSGGSAPAEDTRAGSDLPVRAGGPAGKAWAVAGVGVLAVAALGWFALGRTSGSAASATAPRSIAVLPFANLSGDTTYDYFAEGISDELRSALTSVPGLSVKARGSSVRFHGKDVDLRDAGAKLEVDALVTASVSRQGDKLHVTAELVEIKHLNALWSQTFDAPVTDIAAVQDSISRAIVGSLKLSLASGGQVSAGRGVARGTTTFEAYDLYLQGRHALWQGEFGRAIGALTAATAKDPTFARAHGALAFALVTQPSIEGVGSGDSAVALARQSIARLTATEARSIEAIMAAVGILHLEFRFAEAHEVLAAAVRESPESADLHYLLGSNLALLGRMDEAVEEERRAVALDPLNAIYHITLQFYLYARRDFRATLDVTPRVLALLESYASAVAYENQGAAYLFLGMPDSALLSMARAFPTGISTPLYGGRVYPTYIYAATGRWRDARAQRALFEREPKGNSPHLQNVVVHLAFSQVDSAMMELERSVASREPFYLANAISCDPMYDPLKNDPRFGALMQRLGAHVCPASGRSPVVAPTH